MITLVLSYTITIIAYEWKLTEYIQSHSPSTTDIHWKEGIGQSDFRWISVIYKLVGKEYVVVHAVSEEDCEANHEQQLTSWRNKEMEKGG